MAKELVETIEENAHGPAEVSGDSGLMKQHSLYRYRLNPVAVQLPHGMHPRPGPAFSAHAQSAHSKR